MLIAACAHLAPSYLYWENLDVHFLTGLKSQGFHYFVSWMQERLLPGFLLNLRWVLKEENIYVYNLQMKNENRVDIEHH